MKKFNLLTLMAGLVFSFSVNSKQEHYGDATVLEVTSIYDGDTFRANIKDYPAIIGEHMSIRINDIDTPELRGKCDKEKQLARKAKQFTVEHLREAKSITLGDKLIGKGHAVKYQGKTKYSWC